jgi:hypothetical protein
VERTGHEARRAVMAINMNGQAVFSCGIEFGIAGANSRDLREATF